MVQSAAGASKSAKDREPALLGSRSVHSKVVRGTVLGVDRRVMASGGTCHRRSVEDGGDRGGDRGDDRGSGRDRLQRRAALL